jgi:hypothetical protein
MFPTANTQVFRNSNDSLRYINQFLLPFYLTYRIQLFFLKWRWVIKYSRIMLEVKPDFKFFQFLKLSSADDVIATVNVGNPEQRNSMKRLFQEWVRGSKWNKVLIRCMILFHLTLDKQIWCWTGKIGFKKLANEVPRPSKGTKNMILKTFANILKECFDQKILTMLNGRDRRY